MKIDELYKKALNSEFLTIAEGLKLYTKTPLAELMHIGNELRKLQTGSNNVGWIIDRNVNITNACISRCKFCNFHRKPDSSEVFITTEQQYEQKINELFELGGNQLLLQGGLHPKLKIEFYENLFASLKQKFPNLKLHALGPPEIVHISKISKISIPETLRKLRKAGLDSLPGAGAEILTDRVRKSISPYKCTTEQWYSVMIEAHRQNIITSATMMFGHVETKQERLEHLEGIRNVQAQCPAGNYGFVTFVPWPFQDNFTELKKQGIANNITNEEYIRTIAISRIMLPNVKNIQASWLTVGKETAQICLHAGANDFGSIMIEENVVSSAGSNFKFDATGIQEAIREAGFVPRRRNQAYEFIE